MIVLAGYGLYLRDQLKSTISPNISSWALWTFGEAITILVYSNLTDDLPKLAVPVACLFGSSLILAISVRTGRFVRPDKLELTAAALDLVILYAWVTDFFPSLTYGLLLLSTTISFIPILRSTYTHPQNERASTWIVWTLGYCAFLAVTVVNWEGWASTALPALYCVLNACVAMFAREGRTRIG